ncbi:hypothetical protein ABQF33_12215 [Mycolicibacterium sp. XJ2]
MEEDESEAAQFYADGTVVGPDGQVIPEGAVGGGGPGNYCSKHRFYTMKPRFNLGVGRKMCRIGF